MKLTIALQTIIIIVISFLLVEANKTMDSIDFMIREEVRAAYMYSCTQHESIPECVAQASDYISEFVK